MAKRAVIAAAAIAAFALPAAAHARADNARPAEEDRIEIRGGGGASAQSRLVKPRVEKRRVKRRYPLM